MRRNALPLAFDSGDELGFIEFCLDPLSGSRQSAKTVFIF
jgi:hypothetical protein